MLARRIVQVVLFLFLLSVLVISKAFSFGFLNRFIRSLKQQDRSALYQPVKAEHKPIPAGKDAFTWKEYNKHYSAWMASNNIRVYEEYGKHSPIWDDKFKNLLNAVALNSCKYGEWKDNKTMYKECQDLNALGCDDPLFIFMYSCYCAISEGEKKAQPLRKKCLSLMEEQQYPPFCRFLAARNLLSCYEETKAAKDIQNELSLKKMKYLAESASEEMFKDGNQRYFFAKYLQLWKGFECTGTPENIDVFMKEFNANPDVEPWIRLTVQGYHHVHIGWEARGNGYASTVTDDGWKVFREELAKATECLTKAHEMHPEFPEAATKMISVAMASSCGSGSDREWFDRAVAAQFDYTKAYHAMLWALRPRWGGSHREMYEFGLECLNTKRFDTYIPIYFRRALKDMSGELDDWRDAYRKPGVYEECKIFFEGMQAEPSRADCKECWASQLGMTAWLTGHYDDAKVIFDELGDKLHEHAFTDFNCEMKFAVAETRLRTGLFKDKFDQAESFYQKDKILEALSLYEDLSEKLKGDESLFYIQDRLAVLRMKQQYRQGEWVDLMPDASLTGWQNLDGKWELDNENSLFKGKTTGKESSIICLNRLQLEGNYEIRGEMEAKYRSALILGYSGNKFITVRVDRYNKNVAVSQKFYAGGRELKKMEGLPANNRFYVKVENGKVSVSINDTICFEDQSVKGSWWDPHNGQFGVGDYFGKAKGHIVRYRNLQIRKLPDVKQVSL